MNAATNVRSVFFLLTAHIYNCLILLEPISGLEPLTY